MLEQKRPFQVEIEAKVTVLAFDEASARKKVERALAAGRNVGTVVGDCGAESLAAPVACPDSAGQLLRPGDDPFTSPACHPPIKLVVGHPPQSGRVGDELADDFSLDLGIGASLHLQRVMPPSRSRQRTSMKSTSATARTPVAGTPGKR